MLKQSWRRLGALLVALLFAAGATVAGSGTAAAQTETPEQADWFARYWNNTSQEGQPVLERNETVINYDWGLGSPASAVNPDRFSAQWTSPVFFEEGTYRFSLTSDDGARVWLDDRYIIDSWTFRAATTDFAIVNLEEGIHNIAVDYFEDGGQAEVSFGWQRVGAGQDSGDRQVTISPMSGPVGTNVNVTATGFTPGSTVTVGIGRAASETTTDFEAEIPANGVLQTSITVPESAEVGEPWRVLILGEGGERALSGDFMVTSADGQTGDCGATYVVQPNDWLSKIARNCGTTLEAILAANPQIQDPDRLNVGQRLNMPTGTDDEDETGPRVLINPRRGAVGTTIMADIRGFEPNTEVSVAVRQPNELPFSGFPATTDAQGNLLANVQLPDEAQPGDVWHVLVRSDEQSAESAPFTVTTPGEVTATTQYNINFRSGPSTDFTDLDTVPAGTTLPVLEVSPDGNWIRVQYEGRDGWIASWLTNISGSLDDVPSGTTAAGDMTGDE